MRFTQDSTSATLVIRGYSPGELRINDETYRETVMLSGSAIVIVPQVRDVDDLPRFDVSQLLALGPELVLLGTGPAQVFPAADFRAKFSRAGIGFDVMDTGAACRTFNVLVAEQRRVAALLMVRKSAE
jgi:uncharacterized protein